MIVIRLTFKDESTLFVNEGKINGYKKIKLTDNILKAFKYQSILEFKVSFKVSNNNKFLDDDFYFDKKSISKFEAIDIKTLDIQVFNIDDIEKKLEDIIYVNKITFERLKYPPTQSGKMYLSETSYILPHSYRRGYDENIVKIGYYKNGFDISIEEHGNWWKRYDGKSWHETYENHHHLLLNPIIQQIYLLNLPNNHEFTFYEKRRISKNSL